MMINVAWNQLLLTLLYVPEVITTGSAKVLFISFSSCLSSLAKKIVVCNQSVLTKIYHLQLLLQTTVANGMFQSQMRVIKNMFFKFQTTVFFTSAWLDPSCMLHHDMFGHQPDTASGNKRVLPAMSTMGTYKTWGWKKYIGSKESQTCWLCQQIQCCTSTYFVHTLNTKKNPFRSKQSKHFHHRNQFNSCETGFNKVKLPKVGSTAIVLVPLEAGPNQRILEIYMGQLFCSICFDSKVREESGGGW